jgi:hypothetical protein
MLRRLKEQMCRSVPLGQAGKTRDQCHLCFERKKELHENMARKK